MLSVLPDPRKAAPGLRGTPFDNFYGRKAKNGATAERRLIGE